MKISKQLLIGIILVLLCVIIAVTGLAMNKGAEFGGSDGEAEEMIGVVDPDYEPWAESLIELPSGEVESLLFSLQAAIGSGVIFFCFGYLAARKKYAAQDEKAKESSK